MSNRLPMQCLSLGVGIALFVAGGPGYAAEPTLAAQEVWERFVDICPAIVAAADPVAAAASVDGEGGGTGRSEDGRLRAAVVELPDLLPDIGDAVLHINVDSYDDGRTVFCALQLFGAGDQISGLTGIVLEQASRVLGEETALAGVGGTMSFIGSDGVPMVRDLAGEMVRVATVGFPPDTILNAELMPTYARLGLTAVQARRAE